MATPVQTDTGKYICDDCGKIFQHMIFLIRHSKRKYPCVRSIEKPIIKPSNKTGNNIKPVCDKCKKTFCNKYTLAIHSNKCHGPNNTEAVKEQCKKIRADIRTNYECESYEILKNNENIINNDEVEELILSEITTTINCESYEYIYDATVSYVNWDCTNMKKLNDPILSSVTNRMENAAYLIFYQDNKSIDDTILELFKYAYMDKNNLCDICLTVTEIDGKTVILRLSLGKGVEILQNRGEIKLCIENLYWRIRIHGIGIILDKKSKDYDQWWDNKYKEFQNYEFSDQMIDRVITEFKHFPYKNISIEDVQKNVITNNQ